LLLVIVLLLLRSIFCFSLIKGASSSSSSVCYSVSSGIVLCLHALLLLCSHLTLLLPLLLLWRCWVVTCRLLAHTTWGARLCSGRKRACRRLIGLSTLLSCATSCTSAPCTLFNRLTAVRTFLLSWLTERLPCLSAALATTPVAATPAAATATPAAANALPAACPAATPSPSTAAKRI
jgi:hypothetical protein